MDKTTSAESKPDYTSVLSGSSQAPKVEISIENLLTVNDDGVRVPNILYQQVDLSKKSSQSMTIPTISKKHTSKPQRNNALICSMYLTQYITSTDKLMMSEQCEYWCCAKCLKMSSNEHNVLIKRSDCHWFFPECNRNKQ